jgi:SAM-dependent methyltransferase
MANFRPLKRSILFCLKRLLAEYDLRPEFLDIGCGIGDVSVFLAEQGWTGKAIDVSDAALAEARLNLGRFPGVQLEKEDFFESGGTYGTVLMFDILEHLADDAAALGKLAALVRSDGHAVLVVPSNPRQWGWDDDFYGHIRRYTEEDIKAKLRDVGLEPLEVWDFTFPVFTVMRGIYIRIARAPAVAREQSARSERTLRSGMVPEWQSSSLVGELGNARFFWDWVYRMQFRFFRHRVRWGHEIIVLAKKTELETTHG